METSNKRWWEYAFVHVYGKELGEHNLGAIASFIKEVEDRKEKEAYQKGREDQKKECSDPFPH